MNKYFWTVLLASTMLSSFANAKPNAQYEKNKAFEKAAFEYQAKTALEEPKSEQPKNKFVVAPMYLHSHNSAMTTNISANGGKLKMDKGSADGGGLTISGSRQVSDKWTMGMMYQYISMDYKGGALIPNNLPQSITSKDFVRNETHAVGTFANLDLKKAGRAQFLLLQVFDDYEGTNYTYNNGTQIARNSLDNMSDRVTTLVAWYEVDAPLSKKFTLTPYGGWKTLYVHVSNPEGQANKYDSYTWSSYATGGMKLNYQDGLFGANLRGGVSHRIENKDLPGFAARPMAWDLGQPGYHTKIEQTVGTFGVGVNYFVPKVGAFFGGYDNFIGSKTDAHTISAGLAIPF